MNKTKATQLPFNDCEGIHKNLNEFKPNLNEFASLQSVKVHVNIITGVVQEP